MIITLDWFKDQSESLAEAMTLQASLTMQAVSCWADTCTNNMLIPCRAALA